MTQLRNSAEGGTNNQTVTAGNSGGASGDAFTAVTAGLVYSNADPVHGAMGFVAPTSAADAVARWAISGSKAAARLYMSQDAQVSSDHGIIRFAHTTDTTACALFINNAGVLKFSTKAGVHAWTPAAQFPVNADVRVELYIDQGAGASDGSARAAYFLGDSTTPVYDSGVLTGLALGADIGALTQVRMGKLAASASPLFRFDDFAVNTGADAQGLIGPYGEKLATPQVTLGLATKPTAVGGNDGKQVVTWSAVPGAGHYDAGISPLAAAGQSDITVVATDVTSPYEFTGLTKDVDGRTFAIRARP